MFETTQTLGDISRSVFAGKAASRLPPGEDTLAIVNMRDVDMMLTPRTELETQAGVNAASLSRLALEIGDIVMTSRGAIRAGVAKAEHAGAIPGANTVVIRLRPDVPPRVIASYLRHPRTVAALLREFVGSTTAGFSVAGLTGLTLALPEQEILGQMDEMIDAAERYVVAMNQAAQARQELALELVARNLLPEDAA